MQARFLIHGARFLPSDSSQVGGGSNSNFEVRADMEPAESPEERTRREERQRIECMMGEDAAKRAQEEEDWLGACDLADLEARLPANNNHEASCSTDPLGAGGGDGGGAGGDDTGGGCNFLLTPKRWTT